MGYVIGEFSVLDKKLNREDGNSILNRPAYREKYKQWFQEAQRKAMDMVQFYDGTIVLIENKIAMYYYTWCERKMDFERQKQHVILTGDHLS